MTDYTLVENRQPRCPCVLVVDSSHSMAGASIESTNSFLHSISHAKINDTLLAKRLELAIVSFSPIYTSHEFATLDAFSPSVLEAQGSTPLGGAILHALTLIEARKCVYQAHGISYFRPQLLLISDGMPDPFDDWRSAATSVQMAEIESKLHATSVSVSESGVEVLGRFSRQPVVRLSDLNFLGIFEWLARSVTSISRTNLDPSIGLPKAFDWGKI